RPQVSVPIIKAAAPGFARTAKRLASVLGFCCASLPCSTPIPTRLILMAIATINPATGETLKSFEALTDAELERKLQLAADTFRAHRRTPFQERREKMRRAAEVLESDKGRFARVMTVEMGKPIKAAISEAEKCAWVCRYYADN